MLVKENILPVCNLTTRGELMAEGFAFHQSRLLRFEAKFT